MESETANTGYLDPVGTCFWGPNKNARAGIPTLRTRGPPEVSSPADGLPSGLRLKRKVILRPRGRKLRGVDSGLGLPGEPVANNYGLL